MNDVVVKLWWHATDNDGGQIADGEPARGDPTAGLMRQAADELVKLRSQNDRMRNTIVEILWRYDAHDESIISWEHVLSKAKRTVNEIDAEG